MEKLTFKVCDYCHGKMLPQTMSQTFQFNGKEIEIKGIQGYRCENCGNEVYEAKEIRMIDKIIRAMNDKPAVDILNLDETADYLRVSNQTVYNMIKDGRIKAYKVGREWKFLRADIMAYLESTSSDRILSMAAKGGGTDKDDMETILRELEKERLSMNNTVFQEALSFAQQVSKPHSPYGLCRTLGIEIISDKPMHKDGYLVCRDGCKLIFINSLIHNLHRRKFIVSHELGHFLLHRDSLYCCDNILEIGTSSINTSRQEYEANKFASEYLMPQEELISLLPSKPLQFSDISKIASHFNVSMTSAALRSVKLSKSEDEILICYDGQRLKWFSSADRTLNLDDIPSHCPVNLSKVPLISDITGAWDSLYDGPVHQEIFQPFGNQKLVLLSGNRTSMEEAYCEL